MTKSTYKDFEYMTVNDGKILTSFPNIGQMLFASMDEFKAYVDGYHNTREFIGMAEKELRNAIEKHPKFCDAMVSPDSPVSWAESEYRLKLRNERGPWTADNIMMEEMAEAFNAYQQGRLNDSLHEFAQVVAVVFRCMDEIKKEMESGK